MPHNTNTSYALTEHAEIRLQQRGIHPHTLDLLLDYGEEKRVRDGGISYFFTKNRIRNASKHTKKEELVLMEKQRDAYIVVSPNGAIITAAWRKHH